jgi:hypothetical protein
MPAVMTTLLSSFCLVLVVVVLVLLLSLVLSPFSFGSVLSLSSAKEGALKW